MQEDLFNNGTMYYGVSNIDKHKYYIFKIKESGYEYEIVEF
jgi:hypothetical protein